MAGEKMDLQAVLQTRMKSWKSLFQERGLDAEHSEILIRAFKEEMELEVWARNRDEEGPFQKIWTTTICAASGKPGPKRKEGDRQVPEGMYHVAVFNPNSKFHLSLGLNYPNVSDQLLSDPERPGYDIYIHGKCVSVGCLALGDEAIEQLYALAHQCKSGGQTHIPVMILPCAMKGTRWQELQADYPQWKPFWASLAKLNQYFEEQSRFPEWDIDARGRYFIKS
jgi:murein L,D-transpeptidase YafK